MAIKLLGTANARISFGDMGSIAGLTAISLAITGNWSNIANGERIVSQWGNTTAEEAFIIQITDTDEVGFIVQNATGTVTRGIKTSGYNLIANKEYRFVFTWRASDQRTEIWINGVKPTLVSFGAGFDETVPSLQNSNQGIEIGHETDEAVDGPDGYYSEFAIWRYDVPDGVASAYGRAFSPLFFPNGLLLYARLTDTAHLFDEIGHIRGSCTVAFASTVADNAPHPFMVYPRTYPRTYPLKVKAPAAPGIVMSTRPHIHTQAAQRAATR